MKNIVVFKPGIANHCTAFECMVLIYKALQVKYKYKFIIIKSENDNYRDPELDIISISDVMTKNIPYTPYLRVPILAKRNISNLLEGADGIITVDPTVYPYGYTVIRYAHKHNIPVWFDSSLTHLRNEGGMVWKIIWRKMTRISLDLSSGVLATVPKCLERFNELVVFNENITDKFQFIGHPVDINKYIPLKSYLSDKIKIIVVSRLVPEKGHLYILEAVAPILKKDNSISITIVGKGPMLSIIKREIIRKGIADQVNYIAELDHIEMAKVLAESDIYVSHALPSSSWEEYFGVSNLEAMSCGLACIVTNTGGIPYVIREKGLVEFVQPRDIIDLRSKLLQMIESKDKRKKMGSNSREYVKQNYSLEVITEKLNTVIMKQFK